jgi:hypothetical protein
MKLTGYKKDYILYNSVYVELKNATLKHARKEYTIRK